MGACASSDRGGEQNDEHTRISVRQPGDNRSSAQCPACKIVLLGNTAAGKTSLAQRFTRDKFDPDTCSTIGAAFTSHVVDLMDGRSLRMDVWDTAGQERYRTLAPLYFRNASGAVVVFDLTDKESFDSSRVWVEDFQEHRPGATVTLVGNKMDMEANRIVTQEGARAFAQAKGLQYIETSAKENVCVSEMFELVAASILDRVSSPA